MNVMNSTPSSFSIYMFGGSITDATSAGDRSVASKS